MKRTRVVAIIIVNDALLLVKGSDKYKEYWTPGGKIEKEESDIAALKRELKEELNIQLESSQFFDEYTAKSPYDDDVMTKSRVYITKISGDISVGHEIQDYVWMTKTDFVEGKFPLIATTQEKIIPDVIKAGYF